MESYLRLMELVSVEGIVGKVETCIPLINQESLSLP